MKIVKYLILSGFIALGLGFSTAGSAQDEPVFTQAELDQMLAPVALYPDTVLSHVLIAATYPLEIVQAARWSRSHPDLRGEAAVRQVEGFGWDPSVQALVAFPELLDRMDRDLEWTQRLGDAFLLQEADVVATVQYLRDQAYAQGNLESNEYVRVVRETEYIYIEPARTRVVYIPYYDPRYVYGHWRWAGYPPYYWSRPAGFSISVGFHWGIGYSIWDGFYFSAFHWPSRHVVVVDHHYPHHHHGHGKSFYQVFDSGHALAHYDGARHWKHDPQHRRGVTYRHGVDHERLVKATSAPAVAGSKGAYLTPAVKRPQTREKHREWAAQQRQGSWLETAPADRAASPTSAGPRGAEPQAGASRAGYQRPGASGLDPRAAIARQSAPARDESARSNTPTRPDGRATSRTDSGSIGAKAGSIRERLAESDKRSLASNARKADVPAPKPSSRVSTLPSPRAPAAASKSGRASGYSSPGTRSVPGNPSKVTIRPGSDARESHPAPTRRVEPKPAPSTFTRPSFGSGGQVSRSSPVMRAPSPAQAPSSLPRASAGPSRDMPRVHQTARGPSAEQGVESPVRGRAVKKPSSRNPSGRER